MSSKTKDKLLRALEVTAEKIEAPDMQLMTLQTFLYVADRGTCTQKDIEEYLGVSNAAASRNVSYWTEQRFDRSEGPGFIKRVEQYEDRRYRQLTLTSTGAAFYRRLHSILDNHA